MSLFTLGTLFNPEVSNAVRICLERMASALDCSGYFLKHIDVNYAPPMEKFYFRQLVIKKNTALSKPYSNLVNFAVDGTHGKFNVIDVWNVMKHFRAPEVTQNWDDTNRRVKFVLGGLTKDVLGEVLIPWGALVKVWMAAVTALQPPSIMV